MSNPLDILQKLFIKGETCRITAQFQEKYLFSEHHYLKCLYKCRMNVDDHKLFWQRTLKSEFARKNVKLSYYSVVMECFSKREVCRRNALMFASCGCPKPVFIIHNCREEIGLK